MSIIGLWFYAASPLAVKREVFGYFPVATFVGITILRILFYSVVDQKVLKRRVLVFGAERNDYDALQKLQYDLYYVKNYSLFFDLIILLQTVEVVLWGKGARQRPRMIQQPRSAAFACMTI